MLPELFALLIEETKDERLAILFSDYAEGRIFRKEMLLSVHRFASREQFRMALQRLAERNVQEGEQMGLNETGRSAEEEVTSQTQ